MRIIILPVVLACLSLHLSYAENEATSARLVSISPPAYPLTRLQALQSKAWFHIGRNGELVVPAPLADVPEAIVVTRTGKKLEMRLLSEIEVPEPLTEINGDQITSPSEHARERCRSAGMVFDLPSFPKEWKRGKAFDDTTLRRGDVIADRSHQSAVSPPESSMGWLILASTPCTLIVPRQGEQPVADNLWIVPLGSNRETTHGFSLVHMGPSRRGTFITVGEDRRINVITMGDLDWDPTKLEGYWRHFQEDSRCMIPNAPGYLLDIAMAENVGVVWENGDISAISDGLRSLGK